MKFAGSVPIYGGVLFCENFKEIEYLDQKIKSDRKSPRIFITPRTYVVCYYIFT